MTERPALAWNFSSSCSGLAAAIMICTKTACNRYAQVAAAALVRHTGRTTSTSDQCYLACHLARVVFISSMPRERNARSPYQKSPKPKAYPRPRIRLHAPTTRQARLLYPLKSYRLAPLLAEIMNVSVSFELAALQDTSSVPSTARQQAQKRVFMQKHYDGCRGVKPALPPTSATPMLCCA